MDYSGIAKITRTIITYLLFSLAFIACCGELYIFLQNDDLTRVEYHVYNHNKNDIHPSISLCFARDIFLESRFDDLGKDINSSVYQEFLKGNIKWNSTMSEIHFDDVTLDIADYLMYRWILYSDGLNMTGDLPKLYIGYQDYSTKCFSVDFEYKKERTISYTGMYLKKNIFPKDTWKHPNFGVYLHYPRQLLKEPTYKLLREVNSGSHESGQYHYFKIQQMEVIRKRNKGIMPCQKGWNNIDDQITRKIVENVGCSPPYWNTSSNGQCTEHQLQELSSIEQQTLPLNNLFYLYNETLFQKIVPPCQEIKSISYEYDQIPIYAYMYENDGDDLIHLIFHFEESTFKVIQQVQQMDLISFANACGGVLGLVVGIGSLQIILFFYDELYSFFVNKCKSKIDDGNIIIDEANSSYATSQSHDCWKKTLSLEQEVERMTCQVTKILEEIQLLKKN